MNLHTVMIVVTSAKDWLETGIVTDSILGIKQIMLSCFGLKRLIAICLVVYSLTMGWTGVSGAEKKPPYHPLTLAKREQQRGVIKQCHLLASHPEDPQKVRYGLENPGVPDEALNVPLAYRYCSQAVQFSPPVSTVFFPHGRVLWQQGRYAEAVKAFEFAAEKRHYMAAYAYLGHAYAQGLGGLPVDREKAKECYEKAAKKGFKPAQRILANQGIHIKSEQELFDEYIKRQRETADNRAPEPNEMRMAINRKLKQYMNEYRQSIRPSSSPTLVKMAKANDSISPAVAFVGAWLWLGVDTAREAFADLRMPKYDYVASLHNHRCEKFGQGYRCNYRVELGGPGGVPNQVRQETGTFWWDKQAKQWDWESVSIRVVR